MLVERTYDALVEMWDQRATWGLENPVHGESRPELWQMPLMRQCPSWTTFDQAGSAWTPQAHQDSLQLPRPASRSSKACAATTLEGLT